MDVEITKQDGKTTRLSDIGITVQDFVVSSISVEGIYSEIEGRSGLLDYGAVMGSRTITVPFYYKAADLHDVPLLRDELYSLIISSKSFYIRELRRDIYQTGENKYIGGKRYLVRITGEFDIEQTFKYGFGEMVFETTELPFAESIGTTQDIGGDGLLHSDELWGYGMGLMYGEELQSYTHESDNFYIYNAGNVGIHPFEQHLTIDISDVEGSVNGFELINKTTGDVFRVNEQVNSDARILLEGPNITRNGLQYLRKTNRKYITLAPGLNEFNIGKASKARVKFDFRFYYK